MVLLCNAYMRELLNYIDEKNNNKRVDMYDYDPLWVITLPKLEKTCLLPLCCATKSATLVSCQPRPPMSI